MALTSRRQRDLEQKRRMARGRRNLSQLAGPVAQGQRTPMNRGSGSVSTVQAPPFQQSDPGGDITQAGLAYKGGKGLFDFTQGKEAYIDKAGNYIKAREPWTIGGENIGGRLSQMGTNAMADINQLFAPSGTIAGPRAVSLADLSPSGASIPNTGFFGGDLASTQMNIGKPGTGLTQLSTGTVPPGIDKLGLAGAGLGTGMSIYDMVDQGITPGNMMGLIGSLGVGASAFPSLGLAGFGPIGMGIGGLGAAGSLFDWW